MLPSGYENVVRIWQESNVAGTHIGIVTLHVAQL